MLNVRVMADKADMIVNGYAFFVEGNVVRVLNLSGENRAAVFSSDGDALETSMDDIELSIVAEYLDRNRCFLEAKDA